MVNSLILRNLFHLVFVVPFFIYIGYYKNATQSSVFTLLIFTALFVILYHAYRYYQTSWWINLMHVFLGALLLALGLIGKNLPTNIFYIFYVGAIVVASWHLYLIYTRL